MLLSFLHVSFSYDNSRNVLSDISFKIDKGEKVALLGLNGAGKSTLMQHINGLLLPSEGDVVVNGLNTKSKSLKEIRRMVGMVFQNPDDQLFMPTVYDDVAFGPRNMGLSEKEVRERVISALNATNTADLIEMTPLILSGGQKKSVSIATVLSMSPEILVMDEPTSGLDYLGVKNFIEIANNMSQTLLISTHDISVARRLCSRALLLENGKIVYDGDMSSIPFPYE